jgi:predicted  nucleic acid-binding Zn-ribbon protein
MTRPYEVEILGADQGASAAFRKVKGSVDDIERSLQGTAQAGRATTSIFKGMTVSRLVVDAVYRIKAALESMVAKGIEYNAGMETAKLGIASIVASQTTLVDQEDKLLKGREALNASIQLSAALVQQLEMRGLQTAATTQQLVEAFQNSVGPATAMGLSLKETQDVVIGIVQAAGALGVPMYQLNEEVRSILGGTINMQSRVAKALGLTNEMVKNWAQQGVLAQRLIDTLGSFSLAGEDVARTWQGLTSNMEEAFAKIAGMATKGIFDDVKEALNSIQSSLVQVNDEGVHLSPALEEVKGFVEDIWTGFKDLLTAVGNFVPWETVGAIVRDIGRTVRMIGEGWKGISESWVGTTIRQGIKGIYEGWQHISGVIQKGTGYLDEISGAQTRVKETVQATSIAIEDQIKVYSKLGEEKIDSYRKAYEKAREFIEAERNQTRKLEQEKADLAQKTADLQIESSKRQLDYKRRLADYDKTEKQLKRELDVLKGQAKPLTEQEQKQERIAEIEERLKRLGEDRTQAQAENARQIAKTAQEADNLNQQTKDVSAKLAETKNVIDTVEQALKASSQGALVFNENLNKTVVTANELAKALTDAGTAITTFNAKIPQTGPLSGLRFDFSKLEKELQNPMTSAAQAANDAKDRVSEISKEAPAATKQVEAQRKEWERINDQADEHLKKLERIKYAMREWGFSMQNTTPEAEGAYAPGY